MQAAKHKRNLSSPLITACGVILHAACCPCHCLLRSCVRLSLSVNSLLPLDDPPPLLSYGCEEHKEFCGTLCLRKLRSSLRLATTVVGTGCITLTRTGSTRQDLNSTDSTYDCNPAISGLQTLQMQRQACSYASRWIKPVFQKLLFVLGHRQKPMEGMIRPVQAEFKLFFFFFLTFSLCPVM